MLTQKILTISAMVAFPINSEGYGVEMQVNADLIKAEREKRAWSQEHLAAAAGVGLRTIQRVESSGIASKETAQALAAVFECQVQHLVMKSQEQPVTPFWRRPYSIVASMAAILLSVLLMATRAHAGEIMLDITLTLSSHDAKVFKLITKEGQQAEASVDNQIKIVLIPTAEGNDRILLTAEIYGFKEGVYSLLSKPKVLTREGVDAKIQLAMADGSEVDINIRPTRVWRTAVDSR